jgi:DNA polymerase III subunit epsilon
MALSPNQLEAIRIAKEKLALHPIYLDTETTGNDASSEIIEISIIDDGGVLLYESLVRPVGKVSPEARRVHGISDELLAGAPRWMNIWPQVEAALNGRYIGAYNADFDLRMLQQTHNKYRMRWQPNTAGFFCIMKLYAQFYGEWNSKTRDYRWQSLEAAGRQCGISIPNSHRTQDDTLLARAVLHHIAESQA